MGVLCIVKCIELENTFMRQRKIRRHSSLRLSLHIHIHWTKSVVMCSCMCGQQCEQATNKRNKKKEREREWKGKKQSMQSIILNSHLREQWRKTAKNGCPYKSKSMRRDWIDESPEPIVKEKKKTPIHSIPSRNLIIVARFMRGELYWCRFSFLLRIIRYWVF